MRYIILNGKISKEELIARQKYIYNVFNVYTIPNFNEGYVELLSLPSDVHDLIIIYGHNNDVYGYISNQMPKEKIIILITCYSGIIRSLRFRRKHVYYSDNVSILLLGSSYDFDFDITNAELDLYNSSKHDLMDKINYSFERLC